MPDHVILLHGLWMRGFALGALKRRLAAAGFAVHAFEYLSVAAAPELTARRLAERADRLGARRLHLLGHSLGGLIALRAAAALELPPGRIVCLGSPLAGSAAARGLAGFPGGAMLMGQSFALLRDGLERWDGARDVGVIAGRLPIGLGAWLGRFDGEHDGTVAVAETRLPGIADHCVVPASHTGLLFSAEAAGQAAAFLQLGHFERGLG
ncbi:MAG: alpha/beta fold hydrolase [Mizugakiibacter sp.]|uniref:esterase/lipase family protein n=1 Tax=Mizugakiibacter sp. TaxID=1972610 RepID=UPI0031BF606D|nr:alpha/beta fold hydrolase [Xanthomonadaceae bacterium]